MRSVMTNWDQTQLRIAVAFLLAATMLLQADALEIKLCEQSVVPEVALLGHAGVLLDRGKRIVVVRSEEALRIRVAEGAPFIWTMQVMTSSGAEPVSNTWRRRGGAIVSEITVKAGDDSRILHIRGQDFVSGCVCSKRWRLASTQEADLLGGLVRNRPNRSPQTKGAPRPAEASELWLSYGRQAAKLGACSEEGRGYTSAAYHSILGRHLETAALLLDHAERRGEECSTPKVLYWAALYRGQLAEARGFWIGARNAYDRAAAIAEELEEPEDMFWVALSKSSAAQMLGDHRQALAVMEGIRNSIPKSVGRRGQAYFLSHLSYAHLRAMEAGARPRDYEMAIEVSRAALALHRVEKSLVNVQNELANLAHLYFLHGDFASLDVVLGEFESLNGHEIGHGNRFVSQLRGEYELQRGEWRAAADNFQTSLDLAVERASRPSDNSWRALSGLARVASASGNLPKAITYWQEGLEHLSEVASEVNKIDGEGIFLRDRDQLIVGYIETLLAANRIDEAFRVASIGISIGLHSAWTKSWLSSMNRANKGRWTASLDRYLKLRAECEALIAKMPQKGHPGQVSAAAHVSKCHESEKQVLRDLDRLGTDLGRSSVEPVDLEVLRSHLGPSDGVAIVFFTPEREHLAFFFDQRRVVAKRWNSESETLASLVPENWAHVYLVSNNPSRSWDLAHVPDGGLGLLRRGRSISLLPTLRVLLRPPRGVPDGSDLFVIDPRRDLRAARVFVEEWARSQPHAIILKGGQATRSRVIENLGTAKHFVFAGHGGSTLVMADEKGISIGDLLVADHDIETAVLLACRAGASGESSVDGWRSPAGALVRSGAQTVIAATRTISPQAAVRFLEIFKREDGLDAPAAAYARAVLELRSQGDPLWNAFVVYGRP